jgi:hypothetical protein
MFEGVQMNVILSELEGTKNLGLFPNIALENEILRHFAPQNDISTHSRDADFRSIFGKTTTFGSMWAVPAF